MAIYEPGNVDWKAQVFVNGKKIAQCFYADTKRGIARVFRDDPPKVHKYRKRLIWRQLRGKVEVLMPDGSPAPLFVEPIPRRRR